MRKVIPFIIVVAFWGIFYLGFSNPETDDYILGVSILCIVICLLLFGKRFIWKFISNSK